MSTLPILYIHIRAEVCVSIGSQIFCSDYGISLNRNTEWNDLVLLPVLGFTLCLWIYWQSSILLIILHGHWMYQRSTVLMRSQHIWFLILLFWLYIYMYISPCPSSSRLVRRLLDPWSCWFMTTSVSESSAFRILNLKHIHMIHV